VDIADKALAESVAIRAVAPEIAVIANIPQNRHEAFGAELQDIINIAHGRLLNRAFVHGLSPKEQKTFEEIEAAVNALRQAFGKLKGEPKALFIVALRSIYERLDRGDHIGDLPPSPEADDDERMRAMTSAPVTLRVVRALASASSTFVNKNPNRKDGKGIVRDWNFQGFVRELWACAHKHGGALTANCKNNVGSGTMFKALERLRLLFEGFTGAEGFIKPELGAQAQTIANIVGEARLSIGAARYLKEFGSKEFGSDT
jgi:hypothetical protein